MRKLKLLCAALLTLVMAFAPMGCAGLGGKESGGEGGGGKPADPVTFDQPTFTVKAGETKDIEVVFNNNYYGGWEQTIAVSDSSIAFVTPNGYDKYAVTGVYPGTTELSLTLSDWSEEEDPLTVKATINVVGDGTTYSTVTADQFKAAVEVLEDKGDLFPNNIVIEKLEYRFASKTDLEPRKSTLSLSIDLDNFALARIVDEDLVNENISYYTQERFEDNQLFLVRRGLGPASRRVYTFTMEGEALQNKMRDYILNYNGMSLAFDELLPVTGNEQSITIVDENGETIAEDDHLGDLFEHFTLGDDGLYWATYKHSSDLPSYGSARLHKSGMGFDAEGRLAYIQSYITLPDGETVWVETWHVSYGTAVVTAPDWLYNANFENEREVAHTTVNK